MSTLPSNPCNVPETLRSIVREGNAWPSAGIIGEAANLLDDADTLLGRLAECFGDDETEFADIKLMRDRIADVDTRARHDATVDSARAHGNETSELPPVRRFRPLVEGGHIHSMSEVGNPNGHGGWHVEYVLAVDYDKLARRSEKASEQPMSLLDRISILDRKVTVCDACLCASCWQGDFYCDKAKTAGTVEKTVRELFQINAKGVREDSGYWFKDPSTGKVDYDAKSAAKRAFNALSEGESR